MNKELNAIIKQHLSTDELIQEEVVDILDNLIPKIIECGIIQKTTGEYRYSSEPIHKDNTIKRIINNISPTLKTPYGYRVALVNTTKENLNKQSKTLKKQLVLLLQNSTCHSEAEKIASDIINVLLTSWLLVWCRPNESGWANS